MTDADFRPRFESTNEYYYRIEEVDKWVAEFFKGAVLVRGWQLEDNRRWVMGEK